MRVLLDNDVILDFLFNAFYTTRKEKGKDVAFKAVENLLKIVEVCRTNKSVLQDAFTLNFSDFEDAVQCASAIAENLDAIVTRNTKDYKLSPIKVFSPDDFLQYLQTI